MPAREPDWKKRPKLLCLKLLITNEIVTHYVTGYKVPNVQGERRAALTLAKLKPRTGASARPPGWAAG